MLNTVLKRLAAHGFQGKPSSREPVPRLLLMPPGAAGRKEAAVILEPDLGQPGFITGSGLVLKVQTSRTGDTLKPLLQTLMSDMGEIGGLFWPEVMEAEPTPGWPGFRRQGAGQWYLDLPAPCIARCRFCSKSLPSMVRTMEAAWNPKADHLTRIAVWLKYGGLEPGAKIIVGGAEPLNFPELVSVFRLLRAEGFRPAILSTTGWPLAPGLPAALVSEGLKLVEIPLYGADVQTHDSTERHLGAFDKTLAAIQAFQEAGLNVRLHTVLLKNQSAQIKPLADLTATLGVNHLTVRLPSPLAEAPWMAFDVLPSLSEVRAALSSWHDPPLTLHLMIPPCAVPQDLRERASTGDPSGRTLREDLSPIVFGAACAVCTARSQCPGLSAEHLHLFGEADLQPI